ncbi:hypothetical protein VTO42DRAFT_1984 [Malbranchea cinnamomea]
MGRIEKTAGTKHEATISPAIANFAQRALTIPVAELPAFLSSFPRRWPFPRGDLYHWIGVLNRFDELLARVINHYELHKGPQTKPFGRFILVEEYHATHGSQASECDAALNQLGFSSEGDRELVESILDFSRLLLEKCGNRSLYSSSERLSALLNTTSLSLIQCVLRFGVCLAQRYYSRARTASSSHFHQTLLAAHYNIELDRVYALATPFPRPFVPEKHNEFSSSIKGKEKADQEGQVSSGKCNANDFLCLTRASPDEPMVTDDSGPAVPAPDTWQDWGTVRMSYYPRDADHRKGTSGEGPQAPTTPTPFRRSSSTLSSKGNRASATDETAHGAMQTPHTKPDEFTRGMKVLELSFSELSSHTIEQLLEEHLEEVPHDLKYELLNRLRIAYALSTSPETRRQILAIRMLAITNLAYVYPESVFQQKILNADSDEPKRLQLAYQLAEYVHLGVAGDINAPTLCQTFALLCLDALAKHKARSGDVCAALNVNVNHGILMFLVRKAVADLAIEDAEADGFDGDDWREALFALLRTLPSVGARTPETLVSAGLIPLFVSILNLRTGKARRAHPRVLEFLDSFVHTVRDALATLASARGFDALSDIISSESKSAFDLVLEGNGMPVEYRTPSTDYQIPYFHQQVLRWLFKFVNHVMQHNSGGFERLLRNLIDSPPLLTALRLVLENAKIFGSHVWSGAVNIMSHFIHNEPTSYAVIAEAGLSRSFLEAVMGRLIDPQNDAGSIRTMRPFIPSKDADEREGLISRLIKTPARKGSEAILPSAEAIVCIPLAFGAICLNSTGLELFNSSDALERFFDIFESPSHVKCMKGDTNLLRVLGNSFDELIRHHPALKEAVMSSILRMVARLGLLAKYKAWECALGTKLWVEGEDGKLSISGGHASAIADIGSAFTQNIEDCLRPAIPGAGDTELGGDARPANHYGELFGPPKVENWSFKDNDNDGLTASDYVFPVMRFLAAFFENQSICSYFIESGGVEYVLDFATLQSLPHDFRTSDASLQLTQVIHFMAETKPHLVLPSVLSRAEDALDKLEPFWSQLGENGFFSPLTTVAKEPTPDPAGVKAKGTYFAKHLVTVQTLIDVLREAYTPPLYATRSSQQNSMFMQTNLADKYASLVKKLGKLHAACVWEEILLQKDMPDSWNEATGAGLGSDPAHTSHAPAPDNVSEGGDSAATPVRSTSNQSGTQPSEQEAASASLPESERGAAFKNVKTLRFLLGSLPSSITGFFHVLGHGIVPKRRIDVYQRQNAVKVGDAIASAILEQLNAEVPRNSSSIQDRLSYLIVILSSFSQLLFETTAERPQSHCLTMILHCFNKRNGLQVLKDLCHLFLSDIREIRPAAQENAPSKEVSTRLASAYGGIKIILSFFAETTSARYIVDSPQTQSMAANERDRDRPEYLLPAQFLVELRMAALPLVQEMWGTSFVDNASSSIIKTLIDILRSVLEAECEAGAYRRGSVPPSPSPPTPRPFNFHRDRLNNLIEKGYDETLCREALYRCNNVASASEEYCLAQRSLRAPTRCPIPSDELEPRVSSPQQPELFFTAFGDSRRSGSSSNAPTTSQPLDDPIATLLGHLNASHSADISEETAAGSQGRSDRPGGAQAGMRIQDLLNNEQESTDGNGAQSTTQSMHRDMVTVEDLDAERDKIRGNLIERCLDILNVHHDITFELADLIGSATLKHRDQANFRKEVGETLMHFLISLQMEENFETGGKKIAAYANLLALVLQDKDIYEATLDELKENFSVLLGFIRLPTKMTEKPTEETCPWIGQVLLIMERVLSDDAQPVQIRWTPPNSNEPEEPEQPAQLEEPVISLDDKMKLFESIVDILPRIGKAELLALSICRILVILTRERSIAVRLGEKRNLQRLFVMIKQLANAANDRLQSGFMLILRHIIEDEDTIRQIMRSEIVAGFEGRSRPIDTTGYVRQFYHLVLRSPQLFVEVTNEKLKLQSYDPHQRPQQLVLKQEKQENNGQQGDGDAISDDKEGASKQGDNEKATVDTDKAEGKEPKEKAKAVELKTPIVEHPDGVIHYILSELLSYRDVDDKEPAPNKKEKEAEKSEDVEMTTGEGSSTSTTSNTGDATAKKPEKPQFKAEDHPIYIYRCFLLQCLAELLSSYNRTKVEFINFSRKADPLIVTPSKPRSGILNYLLNTLIPVGTLEHDESIAFKKRVHTSGWAMRVIVALCTKTGELGRASRRRSQIEEEDEPELLFVRRFVLEHALRSFKDANSSHEPLDSKYARLMCLADLFDKMLSGSSSSDGTAQFPSSSRQIAKTMFEKNFIAAFTSAIADIDLNFPSAKRAVKYILRPLNKLTQTALLLSETSSLDSLPGQTDETEISSATSVSDWDDEREETPDLFRHSTLGMFEPDQEEGSTTEESEEDEEMYEDEYDDEMYDEEEMPENDGEVVSEEEEDERGPIEGLPGDEGMDVEVMLESDMSDEEDEDDEDDEDEEEDDEEDEEGYLPEEVIAGEITADHENDSMHEGDEGEWESEDFSEEEDEEEAMMDELEEQYGASHGDRYGHPQPDIDNILRVLGETSGDVDRLESEMGLGGDTHDDLMEGEDVNEDEEDEEEIDELEEDMDDFEDEQDEDDIHSPWGWDEPVTIHRLPARTAPPFNLIPGGFHGRHGLLPVPSYRTHHTRIPPPRNDDGVNPLLRRGDRPPEHAGQRRPGTEAFSDWVHAMDPSGQGRFVSVDSPVSFMNAIMQVISQGGTGFGVLTRPDGIHVHLDRGALPTRIQDIFGLGRQSQINTTSRPRDDPAQAVTFVLTTTSNRWQEESRILFTNSYLDKAQRIVNSLLKVLVPPAIEEEKERQKKVEEELKRLQEERQERERKEKLEREKAEEERKRKEEEEEARRRQEEAERAAEGAARGPSEPEPMEGIQPTGPAQPAEQAQAEGEAAPAGPSEPQRRIHTTIRGRQIDITGMEIDPEYLEALPEELREEVIMQQLAEQRSQAAAAGEEPSEINPEFLEALPPEIREELLQQEAADRRRREREAARRQAAASGTAQAEDMDPASFIATLDPALRQTVLADQPEEVLAALGPEFVSEARALTGRRLYQFDLSNVAAERNREEQARREEESAKKQQRRPMVQLLDKPGVATLLRLMFMPLQGNARHHLNDILHNVCQNRQNRTEVISLLLSILQDGSADISAVERSFAHLSLRARTPIAQKTPQSVKRMLPLPSQGTNNDVTPLMVIQQCLSALSFLTQYNPHIAWFFLTEHETPAALKLKALRKGKAKENRANKFAINSLLSLLDRKIILDSPSCMEQLSSLLSNVTQPLTVLRKEKEKEEEEAKAKAKEQAPTAESTAEDGGAQRREGAREEDTTMIDAEALEAGQEEGQAPGEEKSVPAEQPAENQKQKKQRTLEPPAIPDYNLELVVRILAAPECNGKTFRETLSTINNLSAVPGAREVFGKELISQAKALSQTIFSDLEGLIPHIQQAKTGTDVQGMALSKFSPSSSDQAKLLRVLTALDYLFDPARADKDKPEAESWEKADVLKTLYENATFGPLWARLSDCLTVIRQKENMLNVATILLPLIESLMVVCKNTTVKDIPLPRQRREFSISSPPPESGMEGLFFKFTEDHRKILNELVRQNPRLMSGTFSLLVKNPKVLEFDNKRNYFNRRLHSRGTEARHPHPPLQLAVRRDQCFLDSFKSLYFKTADEMKYGKLSVRFHGEEGVDAGGVTREWFQVLARGMFNPNYALFIPVASDRTTFHPNRLSGVNQEHLMFFKFIGRIIGKALYEGRVLDCHFSRAVYKRILGKSVSLKDMETLDLDYYKSLVWMLENDITDIITENFSIEVDDFGEKQVIDLVENGRNIPVTEQNKEEYVQRVVEHRLVGSVKEQLDHFLKGFHDIIPADLISIFNEQELELLISGLPEIDVDDWKNNTEYHNYSASSPQIQWFWRAVRSFDKEERAKLLQFVTGTSKVPLNGFRELEGMNGVSKFNIHRDYGNKDRLPSSHTCFNQLDLPEYDSYETLRQRLYTAITAGSEYFGFA